MNAPTPKLKRGLLSRWLGVSTSGTPEYIPMQLVALEERVLYSAGPIPAEVVDVELVSQGNFDGVDASDLGLNSFELDATDTFEYLQQQIDAANSLDSIDAIEPLELVPSDLGGGDAVNPLATEIQAEQFTDAAAEVSAAAVATDLQGTERETAAISAGFDPGFTISGRILHDVDGDGSVDENLGLEGVEVRVYRDLGNRMLDRFDVVASDDLVETTDSNGYYEFTDLRVDETYFIVVSSTTLGEHFELNGLLNAGYSAGDIWGVQTYAAEGALFDRGAGQQVHDGGAFYGGLNAEQSDSAPIARDFRDAARFEHVIRRSVTSSDHLDVDFGFSFNVVTNTLGGGLQDDDAAAGRTVQGSLRQFIVNANAIAGDNEMRFVPVVGETSTSGDSWVIDIENALPSIVDAGTTISGLTYNTDGSLFASPAANVSPNGSVTVGGVDDSLLGPSFRPTLTLSGLLDPGNAGLIGEAAFFEVSNLALVNFSTGIVINGEDASNAFIHDNFIGVHADGGQAAVAQSNGVVVVNADDGRIFDNYIVDSASNGILIDGLLGTSGHAEDWIIQNNYIANLNITGNPFSDGIGLTGGTEGAIVSNNRIENAAEFGIDLWNNRGAVTIENNTIADSGSIRAADGALVGGGIGLASDGNVVRNNEIIDNNATGILVRGTAQAGSSDILSATGNLISSNYFEGNAGLDIDIIRPQDNPVGNGSLEISTGDGMDALDGLLDPDTGSNGIDHPVLTKVSLAGDVLTIEGSYLNLISDPKIELYLLGANGSRFHFDTVSVTDQTSYDPVTGEFSAELTEPITGWPDDFVVGSNVAAIIIDGSTSDTSEFGLATSVTLGNIPAVFDTAEASFFTPENSTNIITTFEGTDPDEEFGRGVTFSIVGGADADLFTIRQDNGELRFIAAPDYENGTGSAPNSDPDILPGNVYSIVVRVEGFGDEGSEREVTVTVTDVLEVAQLQTVNFSQPAGQIDNFTLDAAATIGPDGASGDPGVFSYELLEGKNSSAFTLDQDAGTFKLNEVPDSSNPFGNPSIENGVITYSFDVLVTSTNGYTVTETIFVTLDGDSPPTGLSPVTFTQVENRTDSFQLDTVASDGSPLTYQLIPGDDSQAIDFDDATGVFSLLAAPDFENATDVGLDGTFSVTVEVTSASSGPLGNQIINIVVADENEDATFDGPSEAVFRVVENTTVVEDFDATDPEGQTVSYSIDGADAALFTIDASTGVLEFATAPDFENRIASNNAENDLGTYSLVVRAEDAQDNGTDRDITVMLADENENATFDGPSESVFRVVENTTVVEDFDATDPEGRTVSYSIDGADAALFTIDASTGVLEFATAPDFENRIASNNAENDLGTYSLVVRAEDAQDNGTDRDITVMVADENENATFDGPSESVFRVVENTTVVEDFDATDPEGRTVSYSIDGADAALFTIDASTGVLEFATAPDFENRIASNNAENDLGTYSLVVRAEDAQNNGTDRDITVMVADENENVTFDGPSEAVFSVDENTTVVTDFDSTDPEGEAVNYSISGADAALFTIDARFGVLEFLTAPDFENLTDSNNVENDLGTYSLVVRTQDAEGNGTNRDITVMVTDVDETTSVETVTFETTDFFTQENELRSFAFDAIASDGSELSYSIVGGDDFSEILLSADGTQFSLSDLPNFESPTDFDRLNDYVFTVRVQSDSGIDVTQEIRINVTNEVETVLAIDDSAVVDEGGTVQVDVLSNDVVDPLDRLDGVEIVSVSNGTASFNSAGQLEFVHDGTDTTSAEVTYRIVNQEGDVSSAAVNIVVNPVVDLTQTANDNLELDSVQGSFSVDVVANDSVADLNLMDFRVQITERPSQGTVAVDGVSGDVVFTPFANFDGVDSFQYQLVSSDGQQVLSDVASVSIELRQDTPDLDNPLLNLPTQDVEPIVENNAENNTEGGNPGVIGSDLSVNPSEDEREEGIPPSIVLTADPIVVGQAYVTPDDLSSDGARIGLSLEFEGNVYTYLGRTQFLELANLELSEFELRDSIQGDANQNNQILLSQLIVGVSNTGSSDGGDALGLSVGGRILQTAPFMGVLAGCVGLTTLTVTGSQMYRTLDVGSLLTDDESIEDIISS